MYLTLAHPPRNIDPPWTAACMTSARASLECMQKGWLHGTSPPLAVAGAEAKSKANHR